MPLPLIFPVLLYNGKHPYNYSRDIFTLFGDLEPMARKAFLKPFTLIDVGKIPKEDIRKHQLSGLMELSLCHANLRELAEEMEQFGLICQDLKIEISNEIVEVVLKYNMQKRRFNSGQTGEYIQIIEKTLPNNVGVVAMNIAQAFEARGKEEGKTQALYEARRAIEMLKKGSSVNEVVQETHLSEAEVEDLKAVLIN